MVFNSSTPEAPKELAYDLRQIYAKLVGEHLIDAAEARKSNIFYSWFKCLEDIKTITKHKFKDKKNTLIEYNNLVTKLKDLANKYPTTWKGEVSDPTAVAKIEAALRELEEFLYEKMEEGKVFGEGFRIPGL